MTSSPPDDRPVIVWFRNDLRLGDNPALHAAVATGQPVVCCYIHDEESAGLRPLGGASKWWLHQSLTDLSDQLAAAGGRLDVFRGDAHRVVQEIARTAQATACFWNRRYGAAERAVDEAVTGSLDASGVEVRSFNGCLLHEPAEVRSKTGGAFKVFTPFLRASLALGDPGRPLAAPKSIRAAPPMTIAAHVAVGALDLLPTTPDWAVGLRETWTPGETSARRLLQDFLQGGLVSYAEDRNRPAAPATSRLSPHLRFGEISPRQVFAQARHATERGAAKDGQVDKFISELVWRDFAYNLLADHPDLATVPVQAEFAAFPYKTLAPALREAWRHGQTGYPIVDAGMRQLWRTGVMHNRIRMVAASFLIKHLLADWRIGERWFWDTLCDADPASNPVNWQWVAGSGADAAPYFRIFNPTLQGQKFDPGGDYVRTFVPELAALPPKWIHVPWEAPPAVLDKAGVRLGRDYPRPVVEHDVARVRALDALAAMRAANRTGPERRSPAPSAG